MKTNSGLMFIGVIVAILVTAIAFRMFAATADDAASGKFVLVIKQRARMSGTPDEASVKRLFAQASDCNVTFKQNEAAEIATICGSATTTDGTAGPPHIQQTATFQDAAGLQAVVNALDSTTKRPMSGAGMSPPAVANPPHLQQTAGLDTPQREKAIAVALQR
jgi:hypothetical protein